MKLTTPLERKDIKGPKLYEPIRNDLRQRVMKLKKPRRLHIGDKVTLVFENRHTLLFQVEEMLRAESLTSDDQIAEELAVYNDLMPTDESLSATLFIELPHDADARQELDSLVGLDEHVMLKIGEHTVRAAFEEGRSTQDRISAVQYVRFPLPAPVKQALQTEGTTLVISIDHPNYSHSLTCEEATRASLAADYQD